MNLWKPLPQTKTRTKNIDFFLPPSIGYNLDRPTPTIRKPQEQHTDKLQLTELVKTTQTPPNSYQYWGTP